MKRTIINTGDLNLSQKNDMFALMNHYYDNTRRTDFDRDLQEKDWVLMLLEESSLEVLGFSTQQVFMVNWKNQKVVVLFSGDTIIRREYWGSMGLIMAFGELMLHVLDRYKEKEVYWMLLTKGLRTYKYLPTFFKTYYPMPDESTPPEIQDLINVLGYLRYPGSYVTETGIVKASKDGQYLKEAYHPKVRSTKATDAFFYKANPGFAKGDELLCVTRLHLDNLTTFIKRKLLNLK